ncbi:MAG TPA: I78 family peptidase inhibitor [Alphaproteobacteria bacterium]
MTFKALPFLAFALLLGACAASSNQTGEQLKDIVKAERGVYTNAPCMVPGELVGKPHTVLQTMKFSNPIRVIFPGTPVTADNVSNRLNFKIDKKGNIASITCG